ncbi:MAG: NYN domain-containing protein [Lachnospiraceae bacterium]
MKTDRLVVGILAHVDAGKTTLAENILYTLGEIDKPGRVDHQNTFFDTHSLERKRGITIFSKQAFFSLGKWEITLLDTPGHVDFGAEMERALQILDYALLVINGNDGVQSHTLTLWKLLASCQLPVFIFVNKMDREENDAGKLLRELKQRLSSDCLDFGLQKKDREIFYEELAIKEEELLEGYLEGKYPDAQAIGRLIEERKVFPVFFGSALKGTGVGELLKDMEEYFLPREYPDEFGARVYKIGRDHQNNRLTHIKLTGGRIKVKQLIEKRGWQGKVNQIRRYNGEAYTLIGEAEAGMICTLTGLDKTYAGEALGIETGERFLALEPVLTYGVKPLEGVTLHQLYEKLEILGQEEPGLRPQWKEELQEIQLNIMGEIQLEVLKNLIEERFGIKVEFGQGNIVYKETIEDTVEGVGHFEPLRHYAEVHILLEPLPLGSGLEFAADCSEDILDRNWQRLILTHLQERQHPGVLTGSAITDMHLTLLTGRAHAKHTEGGDFRQAVYRALRQGLRKAKSILLEPIYSFTLEVPQGQAGRAMADIRRMYGAADFSDETALAEGMSLLTGTCPVLTMREYYREVLAYTGGKGRLSCQPAGYAPCHNQEEVLESIHYLPEADTENPCGSIFCFHGAGTYVEWDAVESYMHLPLAFRPRGVEMADRDMPEFKGKKQVREEKAAEAIGTDEIEAILNRTYNANRKGKAVYGRQSWNRKKDTQASEAVTKSYRPQQQKDPYLLVDGYNVIFAWEELKELAKVSLDGARGRLMDILCDYRAMKGCQVILVFDAYRLQGHQVEILDYQNIHVVYTREAETADQYIEKFTHQHSKEYQITVATSDGLEQVIIRGQGSGLLSARELQEEIEYTRKNFMDSYGTQAAGKRTLGEYIRIPGEEEE